VRSKAGRFVEGLHVVGGIYHCFEDKYQMMFIHVFRYVYQFNVNAIDC
jgi:hypothetical protein